MNISIFGLGYVGCVSMGCLANMNNLVIGVDTNKKKIDLINKGKPTISEPELEKLIKSGFRKGKIIATGDFKYAIAKTEITFVCIGTPGNKIGSLNLNYLINALKQIALGIKFKKEFHTVVIRSTIIPGTYKKIHKIIEKYSGKKNLKDFCVIINPEFLREGSAVKDFLKPPFNIIGSNCNKGIEKIKKIYCRNGAHFEFVSEEIAEMIKLVSNSFHSVKISFANEIGNLCNIIGTDSNEVMRILCKDKKLNISRAYLKPGFAFGGSCLPKDISALNQLAKINRLEIPLITGAKITNNYQIKKTLDMITGFGLNKISIWGLSFKVGTDDMRGSPIINVINVLLKKGYDVKVFDGNINFDKLIGSNKEFVKKNFKNVNKILIKDFDKFLKHANVLVINSFDKNLIKKIKSSNMRIILDLVNIPDLKNVKGYFGLCW
jgi:GDP-mannose 6-dehydrogenase